ncbi:HupE/UreJ family protein [Polaribacter batillariae]|uniref:HupE/UreJ family protein n=1 Tax=Polaribacter batillariae TaxID=2808900 RepID=A0ABX7SQT7_9FLAO|nr:HupE/UreJ family protein [Polaribacter batillariae]QTD36590.1 HupE/UreJ family protein [Polaribacter batillariae]
MNNLLEYIQLGIDHILDPDGIDHLLFIVAFCICYELKQWKFIALNITAFTLGHCLTLILVGFNLIENNISKLVEILIPVTIIITCALNFYKIISKKKNKSTGKLIYTSIFIFGLIHGLGFSNFIKAFLFDGESILVPVLGFNTGIEIAQLIIVIIALVVFTVLKRTVHRTVPIVANSIVFILSINLLISQL